MKKIIIALDYNPSARKVAETGYALAKALKAEVAIVHVITEAAFYAISYSPIMGYAGGYTSGTIETVEEIKKEANNFLTASVKHLGDDTIPTMVLQGNTTEAIIKCSVDWLADLVVLGSHSHHGIDRLFSTDIASNLLKHSKIPILAIPTEEN